MQLNFTLPIYWTQTFKTKPDKTQLLGMNWYNNAHYHPKNQAKKLFHSLISEQVPESFKGPLTHFTVQYKLYYKNVSSDPSNIVALIEKFGLDGLIEAGVLTDDSMKYHLGSSWLVVEQDRDNPRCEITLEGT